MNTARTLFCSLILATTSFAAAPSNPILYVTQVPLPEDSLPSTHIIKDAKLNIASTMQIPLGDTKYTGRGGALWIRYPGPLILGTNPRNLTAAAGFGGAVDGNGNATGFQGANSIAVQHPHVHWTGTKAVFSMVVGAPASAADTTQFRWQLYEITNFAQGQTPIITYVAGQPANYNNMQACYDTQDRLIFVSDAPIGMLATIYPQLDQYNSLPCNTGLWRLDRSQSPAELKHIIHAPSGAFTPFVDSTGRVMFVQWDHLSRDVFASYDREVIGTAAQTFNGNGTFDSETGSTFTRGTAANYYTQNFHPEPRNFDTPALNFYGTFLLNGVQTPILNGLSLNHFFPWECREDGGGHETDRHVGRHELGGTTPNRPSFRNDSNLVQPTFTHPIATNFLHLTESPTSLGTFYGINAPEMGTHAAGPIVSYVSTAALNPDNMLPTYVTPANTLPLAQGSPVNIYRNPVPLANGSLLAVHTTAQAGDSNIGTATAPLSNYTFQLRTLITNGTTMVPDSAVTMTTPANVTNIQYYANGTLVTYTGAKLWELDPVEVVSRQRPAQLSGSIAAPEQAVFDTARVHAPTYQKHLRANDLALVVGRNVTRRDAADKQQPFNLKVSWSNTQTTGASGTIYDVGWMQIYQADAIRAYTHDGANAAAQPAPGRRCMPVPMHGPALAEMPVTPGAPAGAVKIADDGSWAAVIPAGRALTWHMLDGTATKSQVKERMEVTFAPGEVRTCAVCHGVNTKDQAGNLGVPTNQPQALAPLLQFFRTNHPPGSVQHTTPTATALKNAATALLNVSRTGGSTGPVSVNFSTANGTALAGTDFTAASGTLNWADGDTAPKTIAVPLLNPASIAANKTLTVTLASPLYADLGATTVNTLTISEPPFQNWLFSTFGSAANSTSGPAADSDGDGLPNILEFALGEDPLAPSPQPQPGTNAGRLTLTFTRALTATDVTFIVETSSDLTQPWTSGSSYSFTNGDTPNTATTSEISRTVAAGREIITVRDETATPARYMRLRVSIP